MQKVNITENEDTTFAGKNAEQKHCQEEKAEVEQKAKLDEEIIKNFQKECEIQIQKLSDIVENSEMNVDVEKKIMDETESFFDMLGKKYASEIEDYFNEEERVRTVFGQLISESKVAIDYYDFAQKLKAKGNSLSYHEEYMIFSKSYDSRKIFKKVIKKYFYKKFAATLHQKKGDEFENSSPLFSTFFLFFKNLFSLQRNSHLNLAKLIQVVLASFEFDPDADQKNPFYLKLKELYDRISFTSEDKESKLSKSQSNEKIQKELLDNLKADIMRMQASEDFKYLRKLCAAPLSQIEETMKLNMEKQLVQWKLENEDEYLKLYFIKKFLSSFIDRLKEETSEENKEILKNTQSFKEQLDSIVSNLKQFAKNNSWHIITEKMMKSISGSAKFTAKELKELCEKQIFNFVDQHSIKILRDRDREAAFSFIMNLADVFCNIKEDEELKIFEKNFTKHLKNVKDVVGLLKSGCLKDFKEYTLIVEYRLEKLKIHYSSYSLSESINRYFHIWIEALMD